MLFNVLVTTLMDSLSVTFKLIGDVIFKVNKSEYNWEKFFLDLNINSRKVLENGKVKEITDIKFEKLEKQDYYDCYIFLVNYNITSKTLEEKIDNISNLVLKKKEDIRIEQIGNRIHIKLRNNNRISYEYTPDEYKRTDFKIPVGYDLKSNKLILLDIFTSRNYGVYIAGSSGGGKSVTLRLILSHLVNSKTKKDIEFVIVNTKRVDLKDFEHCRNTVKYQLGTQGIEELMLEQVEEMERRYKIIEKCDCDDIWEYRKKGNHMPFRLLVIEEISSYKDNKEYQNYMELLASQSRGCGIIPVLVTQLPTADIMKNTIKSNMNTIIGHKTLDDIRSRVICGENGLENLRGEGHNKIFCSDFNGVEYQGLYISKDIMKEIINKHTKKTVKHSNRYVKNDDLD